MAKMKKNNNDNTKWGRQCKATGSLIHCLWEFNMVHSFLENFLAASFKGKHILTIWPNNPTPRYFLREIKTYVHT